MAAFLAYNIRTAREEDIPRLAAIERSAGQLFQTVGLLALVEDDPMPQEVLESYRTAGNLWVAEVARADAAAAAAAEDDHHHHHHENAGQGGAGNVVAFLAVFPITKPGPTRSADQTFLHVAELSVHASHQRRGIAKALLARLEDIARRRRKQTDHRDVTSRRGEVVGLSLTTYRDVAFNGPFYANVGFEEVESRQIERVVGKRGRELWDEEQATISQAKERRCWMVKWLTTPVNPAP